MKSLIAATMLLLTATPAYGAENELPKWLNIGLTTSGSVIYARSDDLLAGRSNQREAPLWLKFDASKDADVSWREALVLYSVDCVAKTTTMKTSTIYAPDGSATTSKVYRTPDAVVPDSNMETAFDMLCTDGDSE